LAEDNDKNKTRYTFSLALIIIAAYVVFFGVVMYQNPQDNTTYEGLKTVTATFGIIVAAVVGYYFGQRPTEAADERAREATGQAAELKTALDDERANNVELIKSDLDKEQQRKVEDARLRASISNLQQQQNR
jgi:hypothetical protein